MVRQEMGEDDTQKMRTLPPSGAVWFVEKNLNYQPELTAERHANCFLPFDVICT